MPDFCFKKKIRQIYVPIGSSISWQTCLKSTFWLKFPCLCKLTFQKRLAVLKTQTTRLSRRTVSVTVLCSSKRKMPLVFHFRYWVAPKQSPGFALKSQFGYYLRAKRSTSNCYRTVSSKIERLVHQIFTSTEKLHHTIVKDFGLFALWKNSCFTASEYFRVLSVCPSFSERELGQKTKTHLFVHSANTGKIIAYVNRFFFY